MIKGLTLKVLQQTDDILWGGGGGGGGFRENKASHFMCIICLAEGSNEMPSHFL